MLYSNPIYFNKPIRNRALPITTNGAAFTIKLLMAKIEDNIEYDLKNTFITQI